MAQFSVIASDGRAYGPVSETGLIQWAAEGRIQAATNIRCEPGGKIVPAGSLPFLAAALGTRGAAAAAARLPEAVSTPQPWMHTLTLFPPVAVVLLHLVTLAPVFLVVTGVFPLVWFGRMHGKMPKLRPDDPSARKAVGFMFIPVVNMFWVFFTYGRLCDRLSEQRRLHGLPEAPLRALATWACVIAVLPFLNLALAPIVWAVFFGKLQASVNELVAAPAPLGS